MTLIDIRRTADMLVSFEESKKKSGRFYEEAGQTSEQLNNLSGMLQVRKTLEAIMEDMQEEYELLEQMIGCLEQVCKNCIRYEEEITDFAEEAGMVKSTEQVFGDFRIPENLFTLLS